jgi:hypothetical protein
MAQALAEALVSAQALALAGAGTTPGAAVLAAADVGAHVLAAAAAALEEADARPWEGGALPDRAEPRPAVTPSLALNTIEVSQ